MANFLNSIRVKAIKGNVFDLSHDVKLSMDMGNLTPILVQECIPGDKFNIRSESLIRFAPMVSPVMHRITSYIHYFFVPNRILWDNWKKFITGNNGESIVPAPPVFPGATMYQPGSLADYLGVPVGVSVQGSDVSALPFAAYQCVYNEYYRDQNLIPEVDYKLQDGAVSNTIRLTTLRKRAWKHDYFTANLPFAQKGQSVTLPMGSFPDVDVYDASPSGNPRTEWTTNNGTTDIPRIPGNSSTSDLRAKTSDITGATSSTINDLRRAFRLQEWLEKMARGGSRYVEQTLAHFGVRSSDARLSRPEYIGGSKQNVVISEVLQTSDTGGQETPLGTMGGHGISASSGKNSSYFCEEHGYIIGVMSVIPDGAYFQGLPRHFSRRSHLDYAWPTFAHIGEQEVLQKEIYYNSTDGNNNNTFGYLPRYAEYRIQPSRVAGEMRTTLLQWHLARKFANRPALNQTFVECVPDTRIFAVTDGSINQHLWCHVFNNVRAYRKLPKYGTPAL